MLAVTSPRWQESRLRLAGKGSRRFGNYHYDDGDGKANHSAVNGVAVGAGLHIAIAADFIISSDKARFRESFVNIGLIPDMGGFYNLPLRIGIPKAKEYMMTAKWIDPKEAESMGLVNKVVSPENLMAEAESLAENLAVGPSRAYAMIKSALNQALMISSCAGNGGQHAGHCL